MKKAILMLDVDKHVTPFDTLLLLDHFPDVAFLHYAQVEPQDAERIVRDAMFARGPDGAANTVLLIGGYDVEKARQVLEVAKRTMFEPFKMSIVYDPRGACTTAAAAVAKALETLVARELGTFEGKRAAIFAGTGPVGQACAKLLASEGAEVVITSRSEGKARELAEKLNEEAGTELIRGVGAREDNEKARVIKVADLIFATGAPGIPLVPLDLLRKYGQKCKVLIDANAVPPYGIEGLEPLDDRREVLAGVYGTGAIVVGKLRNRVEIELVKKAFEVKGEVLNHAAAYEVARSLVALTDQSS